MEKPETNFEQQAARLAEEATDFEPLRPPPPVPTGTFFWRWLDRLGGYAAYAAIGLIAVAFLVALTVGQEAAWVGVLGFPALLLLVFYILYLVRRQRQEQAAKYLMRQQEQERARLEVARLVLEQSRHDKNQTSD